MRMTNRWDPFRDLDVLRRELDRTFNPWTDGGRRLPYSIESFLPGRAARSYPLINLNEDETNVYAAALAPGIAPDSIKVTVQGDTLTLSGEKQGPQEVPDDAWHRSERAASRFTRTLTLPTEVNADKVTADYRNGILCITLPKAEVAKPRQIEVNVA